MRYLIDTNICIYAINNRPPEVRRIFEGHPSSESAVSVITMLELKVGAHKSQLPLSRLDLIDRFASPMTRLPFTDDDAAVAAELRAGLERRGTPIGPYDLLIAAQALNRDLTVVTNNETEFRRVAGLKLENWIPKTS
jgi:tRNA(fMet)-specific endonuclease VapC